jgi:hypothetical protein
MRNAEELLKKAEPLFGVPLPVMKSIELTTDLFWYPPLLREHLFEVPLPDDTVVVRYLSEPKAMRFIRMKSLYFRRHDLLRTVDTREGTIPRATVENDERAAKLGDLAAIQRQLGRQMWEGTWLANGFVACFSAKVDDEKMFREYIWDSNGIMIATTVGKLRGLCSGDGGHGGAKDAAVEHVRYIDMARAPMNEMPRDFPAFYKSWDLEWEDEVRFVIRYGIGQMHGPYGAFKEAWPDGELLRINVGDVVDRIIVAPQSRAGYIDTIAQLLQRNHIDLVPEWGALGCVDREEFLKRVEPVIPAADGRSDAEG